MLNAEACTPIHGFVDDASPHCADFYPFRAARVRSAGKSLPHERFVRDVAPLLGGLLGQACGLTKQQADAEDLVQETVLKAFLSFGSFREGSNLKAWLYRIMVNAWIDGYRMNQRRPPEQLTAEVGDSELAVFETRTRNDPHSAEMEALATMPSRADQALRTLPPELRATIFYADVQGYPNTEIAAILNIPVGTVGSRLHRGRSLLREILHDLQPQR